MSIDARPMSHDQNFKNLIADYPRDAIELFAAAEAHLLDTDVEITPVRQEMLKDRLGDRHRELDVPLLLQWPDGRREAILFVLEEETDPRRFSIRRLAHYCLDLTDMLGTERVVPVVIFLRAGPFPRDLRLGTELNTFLDFRYLAYALAEEPARAHFESGNIVARLNLPNMAHDPAERVEVYGHAVRGLLQLEPDPERRLKYVDFIDIYAALDETEQALYRERHTEEAEKMTRFAERFIEQGTRQAEARVLLRQLTLKYGELPDWARERIEAADSETLLVWLDRVLTADSLEAVLDGIRNRS